MAEGILDSHNQSEKREDTFWIRVKAAVWSPGDCKKVVC